MKNTIGKRIAEARVNQNITQEQLEELSGFSVSTI
ncbi:XRE family transcriptional regulator [Ruminococcus sp. AF41-9]|nr:XRE family transcriptional regulator [Ruminococcus sp. AF41-9]